MFSLELLEALRSETALLTSLAQTDLSDTLTHLTRLRKHHSPPFAAAALETALLRQKATDKFQHANQMFFTAEALQQATHQAVAHHHAQLLADFPVIADLGCSIGGDLIALGQQATVIGLDLDFIRLAMARHNTAVYGVDAHFIQADLTAPIPLKNIVAAFFDPARRDEARRIFSVQDYAPPLDKVLDWDFRALLVKISPGVKIDEIRHLPAGIEFVSYGGELKEALLHLGELAFTGFRATCLPAGGTLFPMGYAPPPVTDQPRRYLYEPDPAVIRSGLFSEMLAHLNLEAYRLDETIAYLTGDEPIKSAWLRCWQIDDWLPFNLKKLRARLVEKGVGKVTVKKRGSPITPEELQKMLHLKKGEHHAVVTLTRLRDQPIVLISYD